MPMTADDLADIKPKLDAAKKHPLNFAVCIGKTPATTVILFSRTKDGVALERLAKKAGETKKTVFGTVMVAEGVATLSCATDVPSGLCKKVRGLLASQKIGTKVRALDPSGAEVGEVDDEDDGLAAELVPGTTSGEIAPDVTAPGTGPTGGAKPPGWDKIVATVGPRVVAFARSGADQAALVVTAWKAALAAADGGRATEAMTIVNRIMPLLRPSGGKPGTPGSDSRPVDAPPQTQPESPPETPAETSGQTLPDTPTETAPQNRPEKTTPRPDDAAGATLVKAAKLWREAVKTMRAEMQKLEDAIVAHLAPDPALAEVAADAGLLSVRLDVFDLDLADMLDAAAQMEPAARDSLLDEARDDLARYRAALAGRFFAEVDDTNGFVRVAVAATARKSLAALEKLIA